MTYLAIGNSLTSHGKCHYWWTECGMAATDLRHDYVHLVTEGLRQTHPGEEVTVTTVNFIKWEATQERTAVYTVIDPMLAAGPDLITVQLGENLGDNFSDTVEDDYVALLRHIQAACPNAKILMLDDVWNERRSAIRRRAAEICGIVFVPLLEAFDESCRAGMGAEVIGEDGTVHIVEHFGVAAHPGNKGMQMIASSILAKL